MLFSPPRQEDVRRGVAGLTQPLTYSARAQDGPEDMERNLVFFPFPVGHHGALALYIRYFNGQNLTSLLVNPFAMSEPVTAHPLRDTDGIKRYESERAGWARIMAPTPCMYPSHLAVGCAQLAPASLYTLLSRCSQKDFLR